jgi:hypothetical protein
MVEAGEQWKVEVEEVMKSKEKKEMKKRLY